MAERAEGVAFGGCFSESRESARALKNIRGFAEGAKRRWSSKPVSASSSLAIRSNSFAPTIKMMGTTERADKNLVVVLVQTGLRHRTVNPKTWVQIPQTTPKTNVTVAERLGAGPQTQSCGFKSCRSLQNTPR